MWRPYNIEQKAVQKFKYEAMDQKGQTVTGELEATSFDEAKEKIHALNLFPTKIETENPSNKTLSWLKKNIKIIGAITGLAVAAGPAGTATGKWAGERSGKAKTETKVNTSTKKAPDIYKAPAGVNLSKLNQQHKETNTPAPVIETKTETKTPPTISMEDTIKKVVDERVKQSEERIKAELEAKYKTNEVKKPAPETTEDILRRAVEKQRRGEALTSPEARILNSALLKQPTASAPGGYIVTTPKSQPENSSSNPYAFQVKSEPGGYIQNIEPSPMTHQINNPLQLSPEQLNQVGELYEYNLSKVFPTKDIAKSWKKVKDKGAHDFMNKKPSKPNKAMFDYLKILKEKTGLEPRTGVRGNVESVEKFMERALQKAIKEGKIKEVTL